MICPCPIMCDEEAEHRGAHQWARRGEGAAGGGAMGRDGAGGRLARWGSRKGQGTRKRVQHGRRVGGQGLTHVTREAVNNSPSLSAAAAEAQPELDSLPRLLLILLGKLRCQLWHHHLPCQCLHVSHRQTDTHTDRQREGGTDRQTLYSLCNQMRSICTRRLSPFGDRLSYALGQKSPIHLRDT